MRIYSKCRNYCGSLVYYVFSIVDAMRAAKYRFVYLRDFHRRWYHYSGVFFSRCDEVIGVLVGLKMGIFSRPRRRRRVSCFTRCITGFNFFYYFDVFWYVVESVSRMGKNYTLGRCNEL